MPDQTERERATFRLEEATIDELHAAIRAGQTTCVAGNTGPPKIPPSGALQGALFLPNRQILGKSATSNLVQPGHTGRKSHDQGRGGLWT